MFDWTALSRQTREFVASSSKKIQEGAQSLQQKTDDLAENVAGKCSELTGKDITADHVKRTAVGVGLAMLTVGVGAAALQAASRQSAAGTNGGQGYNGFDNSFEGQCYGFFADKGGLNIETHTIDQDGCILD